MATKYSEKIEGSKGNYKWAARFDIDYGYLGITQYHSSDEGNKIERVLLSPKQVRALAEFCGLTKRVPDRANMEKVVCPHCGNVRNREVFWEGASVVCKCGAVGEYLYGKWSWFKDPTPNKACTGRKASKRVSKSKSVKALRQ